MKLFEIPIYAYSPEKFKEITDRYIENQNREYLENHVKVDKQHMDACAYLACFPYRVWDYNHIVGYISISIEKFDIIFDLYLQAVWEGHKSRYIWRSKQKWFLVNQQITGYHFRIKQTDTNEEISIKIKEMLDGLVKDFLPEKYYIDRESFDTVNSMVDYSKLFDKVEAENGQDEDAE